MNKKRWWWDADRSERPTVRCSGCGQVVINDRYCSNCSAPLSMKDRNPLGVDYSFWGSPEAMNRSLIKIAHDAAQMPDDPYPPRRDSP